MIRSSLWKTCDWKWEIFICCWWSSPNSLHGRPVCVCVCGGGVYPIKVAPITLDILKIESSLLYCIPDISCKQSKRFRSYPFGQSTNTLSGFILQIGQWGPSGFCNCRCRKKVQITNTETNEKDKGNWDSKRLQISKYSGRINLNVSDVSEYFIQKINTYSSAQFCAPPWRANVNLMRHFFELRKSRKAAV